MFIRYIENNGGNTPVSLKEFQEVVSSLGKPELPVEDVEVRHFQNCTTPNFELMNDNFEVPELEDLHFVDMSGLSKSSLIKGGEEEGLGQFKNFVEQVRWQTSNVSMKNSNVSSCILKITAKDNLDMLFL